jgi:hypothetical protein
MFIRRKIVRGVSYYALVESYREKGKVRQRILCALCRDSTLDAAIARAIRHLAFWRRENERWTARDGRPSDYAIATISESEQRIKVLQDWKERSDRKAKPVRLF